MRKAKRSGLNDASMIQFALGINSGNSVTIALFKNYVC